jgi:hypothetical protein
VAVDGGHQYRNTPTATASTAAAIPPRIKGTRGREPVLATMFTALPRLTSVPAGGSCPVILPLDLVSLLALFFVPSSRPASLSALLASGTL